jgi:hypothetical protein
MITNDKSRCGENRRDIHSYEWIDNLKEIVEIKVDNVYHCFSLGEVYMVQKIMGDRLYKLQHDLVNKSINKSIENSLLKKLIEVELPEGYDPNIDEDMEVDEEYIGEMIGTPRNE